MTVRFERLKDRRICLVTAWAPDRRPFRVSGMGGGDGLPHDLATFAAEQALGVADEGVATGCRMTWRRSLPSRPSVWRTGFST